MNGGEKSEGRLDLTENSLEHCRNADPWSPDLVYYTTFLVFHNEIDKK